MELEEYITKYGMEQLLDYLIASNCLNKEIDRKQRGAIKVG